MSLSDRDVGVGPFTGVCCWCGAPAASEEHVISQWIEKEIEPPPDQVVGNPTLRRFSHGRVSRWKVQRIATKKARTRAVCVPCNTGWMSVQEKRVQPLLGPLFRGHRRTLTVADQMEIAQWACIKAGVCDARPDGVDGGLMSVASRRSIHVFGQPPQDMLVLLAAYEAASDVAVFNPGGVGDNKAGNPLAQWATTLVLGHLVVQIVCRTGSTRPPVLDQLPGGVHNGTSFTVWPPQLGPVEWPPPNLLTVAALPAFLTEMLPGIDMPADALLSERDECSNCGETHGPVIRDLPVPEP